MKRIHILGRKNHGKTTLVVELVEHFAARGFRVGTIKHTHHEHELDMPGKDSHRHRVAGAAVAGILSRSMSAVFWPTAQSGAVDATKPIDRYAQFAPHFADCEFVLVEGDTQADGLKIEVWRQAAGGEPLAAGDASIAAVVTDDECAANCTLLRRSDLPTLAEHILQLVAIGRR